MTVDRGKRWGILGVLLGLVVFALGVFLAREGLENADRWASVISMFLAVAGLVVAVYSVIQTRRTPPSGGGMVATVRNTITDADVAGMALLIRDAQRLSLTGAPVPGLVDSARPDGSATPATGGAAVENRVEGGTFGGPLIMGRDLIDVVLPPESSRPRPDGDGIGP